MAIAAIGVGVLVRAVFVLGWHRPDGYVYSDMQGYVTSGMQLVTGTVGVRRGLAFYPPGTHLLLAAVFGVFGVGHAGKLWADATWFGLSAVVPVFAWRLVRVLLNPVAAAMTAALCAIYPLFILYSGFFASETPTMAFLCGALWLGYEAGHARPWVGLALGVGGGLLGGALVATRPQFLLNLALVLLALLRRFRARWRAALGFSLGLGVVIIAVAAVNTSNAGQLTAFSENGGVDFYLAQCPVHEVFTGHAPGPTLAGGDPVNFQLQRGHDTYFPNHLAWDQGYFLKQGLTCIRKDGIGHVVVVVRNIADLTVTTIPWPLVNEIALSRIGDVTNVLYCAALSVVLLVLWRRRHQRALDERAWSGAGTLVAHLAMLVPVAIVFQSEPRYRVPYDVFGLALLAWFCADTLGRRRPLGHRERGRPAVSGARPDRLRSRPAGGSRRPSGRR
ncbi:MAG: glycosyltransferase family 39 protein [Actinomycetota bacterium]|nr:glycosyltransferase family 39 protein [Actinomycetota bacterium]